MEPKLFKYIWRHSWRDQIPILAIVVVAQVMYLVSLDLPKRIVNDAIQGKAFEGKAVADFLKLTLPLPDFLGGPVRLFSGFQFDQLHYLFALCFSYLFFVVLNGWLKQTVNTEKGRLGERMLRRLRFELFDRVLHFPLLQFRKVKQAEIATMIKDEVEPLGGFIGDAFITPAYLGGLAATALLFIFMQNMSMGFVTIAMLAVQIVVIPKLRVKILMLGKQRQITARQLAGRIAESVDGAIEIHANDTSNYERADIIHRLGRIFQIRFELYQRKFFVKYINNMLAQTTPFLYFLIGGYYALKGEFDVGTLLAVISAYKDLPSPIKELIDWDQQRQDVQIKYDQVIEQFTPPGMMDARLQHIDNENAIDPAPVKLERVTYHDESGAALAEDISLEIAPGEHLAIVGGNNSGKEAVAALLARLVRPFSGNLRYGERDLLDLPESITGRRFAYLGEETYLLPVSLEENLLYSLKHRPVRQAVYEGADLVAYERRLYETKRAGSPTFDYFADWIDYDGAGVADRAALEERVRALLITVEFEEDVYQFGLRGRIESKSHNGLTGQFLEARAAVRARLAEPQFASLVEPFDPAHYNRNMTVAENILFGTALDATFAPDALATNTHLSGVLSAAEVTNNLIALGQQIASTMVELFADLPAGHPFFEQFSFISAEDLPHFQQLVTRLQRTGVEAATAEDKSRLIALTFPYIEARHRLGLIDDALEGKLLKARQLFRELLPKAQAEAIEFYGPDRYNAAATVQDNILFGRLVYGQAQAAQKIGAVLSEVIDSLDLRPQVIAVGLTFNVGAAGKKLSFAQRQKAGLIRALLKRPQLVILNNTLSAFDEASQRRLLVGIRADLKGAALVFITHTAALARSFDRIVVMQNARIVETGKPADLDRANSKFQALLGAPEAVG
ncbi:ABC transporter ATP-binding protein [Dongia rigui]|uniref:ABC transporter ATP-binding protein n=1 Tax=Dongia rigui TaxID=940149 RepID=A0ABU5DWT0_9PROT|nr:ABC transporter ATP-binding protein [Dongia rigui]MDY0871763.1 ABC transporter ATP-binding protein [Dongia rigui]